MSLIFHKCSCTHITRGTRESMNCFSNRWNRVLAWPTTSKKYTWGGVLGSGKGMAETYIQWKNETIEPTTELQFSLLVTVVKYKTLWISLVIFCVPYMYLVILIQLHNQCVQQPNTVSRHPKPALHCWACLNYWKAVTNVDQSVLQQQSQSAYKQLILSFPLAIYKTKAKYLCRLTTWQRLNAFLASCRRLMVTSWDRNVSPP